MPPRIQGRIQLSKTFEGIQTTTKVGLLLNSRKARTHLRWLPMFGFLRPLWRRSVGVRKLHERKTDSKEGAHTEGVHRTFHVAYLRRQPDGDPCLMIGSEPEGRVCCSRGLEVQKLAACGEQRSNPFCLES